jgi:hypothetical protein
VAEGIGVEPHVEGRRVGPARGARGGDRARVHAPDRRGRLGAPVEPLERLGGIPARRSVGQLRVHRLQVAAFPRGGKSARGIQIRSAAPDDEPGDERRRGDRGDGQSAEQQSAAAVRRPTYRHLSAVPRPATVARTPEI